MGGKGKGNDKDNKLLKSADHMWDGKGRGTTMTIIDSNKLITLGGGKGRGMTNTIIYSNQLITRGREREEMTTTTIYSNQLITRGAKREGE